MSGYIHKNKSGDLVYPFNDRMLRKMFPHMSFPEDMSDEMRAQYGMFPVTDVAPPEYDKVTEDIVRDDPTEVSPNRFERGFKVVDASEAEVAARRKQIKEDEIRQELKKDSFVQTFRRQTPKTLETFIQDNVTDLQSAKDVISKLAVIVLLIDSQNAGSG